MHIYLCVANITEHIPLANYSHIRNHKESIKLMGFLQDAESIANRTRSTTVPLKELEVLRIKYDMDTETFKPLRRKSKRGAVELKDIHQYFISFTEPLFQPRHHRRLYR